MAVIRVLARQNRHKVRRGTAGGAPVRQTARSLHDPFNEHGPDVRDDFVTFWLEGRHHRSAAIYDSHRAVIGSAIIPTIVAQRWFAPPLHALKAEEIVAVEDEEFEPPRPRHVKT